MSAVEARLPEGHGHLGWKRLGEKRKKEGKEEELKGPTEVTQQEANKSMDMREKIK